MPRIRRPGPATAASGAAGDGRRRILLVDDEADIRDALSDGLRASLRHVDVHAAASGEEGLGLLRQHAVDLIIADYKMPGMDGLEFLEKARHLHPGTPSVMISGFPDPATV